MILRDNVNVRLSFYTISQMWGEWRTFHSHLFAPIPDAGVSAELQMGTQDSHCLKLWPSTHLSSTIVPSYLAPCDLGTKHNSIRALLILPMSHVPYILFPLPGEMFFPFLPCKLLLIPLNVSFWKPFLAFPLGERPAFRTLQYLIQKFHVIIWFFFWLPVGL